MHLFAGFTAYDNLMFRIMLGFAPLTLAVFVTAVVFLIISLIRGYAYAIQAFIATLLFMGVSVIPMTYAANLASQSTYSTSPNYCIPSEGVTCGNLRAEKYNQAEVLEGISYFAITGTLTFSIFWYAKQKQSKQTPPK